MEPSHSTDFHVAMIDIDRPDACMLLPPAILYTQDWSVHVFLDVYGW